MKRRDLRIAFFGTPPFAVRILEKQKDAGFLPTLVITAPDRPAGRGMQLTPPPVKMWAQTEGIDVLQPESARDEAFFDELRNSEWDLFIVAAYGQILPDALLNIPSRGTLNVHPSLLPKLRGASPVESAILTDARDAVGVSIMLLDDKMDHGPLIAQARIELETWPLRATLLRELLADAGGELLAEVIPEWMKGEIAPEEQRHEEATFCKKLEKSEAELDLSADPYRNFLKINAFDASPRAYFFAEKNGKKIRLIVTDAEFKDGKLEITKVIPEGGKEMSYRQFLASQ